MNQLNPASPEAVVQQIRLAFAETRLGDGMNWQEAALCEAGETLAPRLPRNDRSSLWWDLADAELARFYEVLCVLDQAGFCFYLPACMCWSLLNFDNSDSPTPDWTIYALSLDASYVEHAHRRDWFQQFNCAQVEAIQAFLQFMAQHSQDWCDHEAAQLALQSYWQAAATQAQ